ncbi:MAG: hypothetical protein H0X73_04210 [Chthoniobacterales bacterium]|nr:hypothetical protein [Chthoniobacterales bacterium]
MKPRIIFVTSFLTLAFTAISAAADSTAKAKELFERYIALERAFDAAQADLYSDDAKIQNTRTYPDGQKRTLTFPPADYKKLIRAAMPLAKARGDTSTYSDTKYTPERDTVRITCVRFSERKSIPARCRCSLDLTTTESG